MKRMLGAALVLSLLPTVAFASTLPSANVSERTLGIGLGPSLSFDSPLASNVGLGVSASSPFIFNRAFVMPTFDVRVRVQLLKAPLDLSILAGVVANTNTAVKSPWGVPVGPELGVCLGYDFTPQLVGRLNFVGGLGFGGIGGFGAPASGLELGYRFSDQIEGTIGANGNGDFLGLKIRI